MGEQVQQVATFQSIDDARNAADQVETNFPEGSRGLLEVRLPFDPSGFVGTAQDIAQNTPGVHLYAHVYAQGNSLIFPFQKGQPQIAVILSALGTLLGIIIVGIIVGAIILVIWKILEAANALAGNLGLLVTAGIILFLIPQFFSSGERTVEVIRGT